uniref:AIG1-type G domain-containing protein n=1 Tax=Sinocyclocheilus grahami TaxID=75366 RepID=A0A672L3A1_SINGR
MFGGTRAPTDVTVVLLGKISNNKCLVGNTIFQKDHFRSERVRCEKIVDNVGGEKVCIINTPDLFHKPKLAQPGPDVYLLVMQLGRFTEGEREVLPHLKREFGQDVTLKTLILFTGKEKLKNRTLTDYISGSDTELQELIKTCHARCHAFNNNKEKSSHQVKKLLDLISDMQENSAIASHHGHRKKHEKECSIL